MFYPSPEYLTRKNRHAYLFCSCFLVTYYFTQQILAKYSGTENQTSEEERALIDEEATSFVKRYGAYLQIRSCLSYAAAVKAESPIDDLLVVASHDLSHRDAVKEIQKGKALTFYDTVSELLVDDRLEFQLTNPNHIM